MIYEKYGKTFKIIRNQKKRSLAHFSKIGISRSSISKFERGHSMMKFDTLLVALQELELSLEEFEIFLNNYSTSYSDILIDEIDGIILQNTPEAFESLYNQFREVGEPIFALAAQSNFRRIKLNDSERLTNYFYSLKIWSCLDIQLLRLSLNGLTPRDIIHLLRKILLKENKLFNSKKHADRFNHTCSDAIIYLCSQGYRNDSLFFIQQLQIHNSINSMFTKNIFNISKGIWTYHFKSPHQGAMQIEKSLHIFEELEMYEIANQLRKKYNNFL